MRDVFGEGIPIRKKYFFDLLRRALAYKTTEAWTTTPHGGIVVELDVTNLVAFIQSRRQDPAYQGVPLTLNTVLLKIVAESVKKSPEMNAHVRYNPTTCIGEVTLFDDVNIATPMLTNDGRTFTAVLSQVDKKTLKDVCQGAADLKRRLNNTNLELLVLEASRKDRWARLKRGQLWVLWRVCANLLGPARLHIPTRKEREEYRRTPETDRLTVKDVLNATILVTNIGSVMPELQAQITVLEIIQPQTIALGISALRERPVVVRDAAGHAETVYRQILPICICFDHRVMDFTHLMGFLQEATDLCNNPDRLL